MGCCDSKEDDKEEQPPENQTRGCTDVFWLCVFIAFWSLMVLIAAFSFVYGNPIRIINGYDSFGNTCGTKYNSKMGSMEYSGMDMSNKPYLLFYDYKELRKSLKICVKECPSTTLAKIDDLNTHYQQTGDSFCQYDFNYSIFKDRTISNTALGNLANTLGPCPVLPIYDSMPILNRCVPKLIKGITDGLLTGVYEFLNSWDTLEQVLADLYNTRTEMLAMAFLAFFVSLFTVSILHLLASLVSYIIMILVTISSIGGTCYLWYTYFDIKFTLDAMDKKKENMLLESVRNESAFFWYSIVATIITVVILLLVFIMRKKVDFLANLFKETSKCLAHIPLLFFQPLITFAVLLLFFGFWILVILCLATAYYPGTTGIKTDIPESSENILTTPATGLIDKLMNVSWTNRDKFTFVEYIDATWVKYMWWVYFIGLIWTSEFIMGCQAMVISASVAHWYYRHKYKDNDHVSYAICKLLKYHMGSVAKGSLLITIFKIPRLILMYLHAKLSANSDKGSECAKCGLKCCICCFYCTEKCIRYINSNAYTVIAIDGVNFCKAAKTAFEVLISHSLEVATINSVGDFILFLGKCFVTAVTGCVGLYLFRSNHELKFYAAPTLLVCIFAFFVAHCILSLYEMVLDSVYLCMCQSGEDAPEGFQLENMGVSNAANNGQPKRVEGELEPMH